MNNEMGGSKTDTLIKLVLTFFIALLAFSVGTYVGKQVSDSDYKRAAIEGGADRGLASEHKAEEAHSEDSLSDEDIANLTEEFVAAEKDGLDDGHGGEAQHKKEDAHDAKAEDHSAEGYKKYPRGQESQAESTAPTPAKEPVSEAATRVAAGESPTKDHKKKRKPNSVLPSIASSAVGKYTVQVASYPQENEAKSHAAKLKGQGWNAFYVPAEVKGQTWFRVSVGLFTSQKSATDFRAELLKDEAVTAAIIQKIVR